MLFWAPGASADLEFCPLGEGAGECGASPGLDNRHRLAVDTEEDLLYVADEANNRIDVFEIDEEGEAMKFLFAFGWGVADGTTNAPQTCTTTCFEGIAGEGPGQFRRLGEVAVDNDPASPSQHAIYVSELGNEGEFKPPLPRIQKFKPTGEFVWMVGKEVDKTDKGDLCTKAEGHTCGAGAKSEAEGGFASLPLIATGPGGVLCAVDNLNPSGNTIQQRLQRFEPSGAPIPPSVILFEGERTFASAIAVDATGDLWVASLEDLRKYSPAGSPLAGPFAFPPAAAELAIEIGQPGNLYLTGIEQGFRVITEVDPAGEILRRFAYTTEGDSPYKGLAVQTSSLGEVFFSGREKGIINYIFQPPHGPVPAPPSLKVVGLGSAKATLTAEVNPEGKETSVHFEYVEEATYLQDIADLGAGHGFDHAKSTASKPLEAEGFNLKGASALAGCQNPASEIGQPGKCLSPETKYRWRVVASNADGEGPGAVEGPAFTTKESPELGKIYATGVGTDTARLHGEVNPNGIPATGWFEYVDDATYRADVQSAEEEGKSPEEAAEAGFEHALKAPDAGKGQALLDFGEGEAFVTRQITIYPLAPGTVYHYRLVAENPVVPARGSAAQELRTFAAPGVEACPNEASRIGPGAFLPDCRAYEMVSPPDKEGGDIRVLNTPRGVPAVLEQSSVSGERLAYGSARSFGGAVSAPFTSQYIARRIAGEEWQTHPIVPPRGTPTSALIEHENTEFEAFSADLCETWFTSWAEPPLGEGGVAKYSNLYRRTDELCGEAGKVRYEALAPLTAAEGVTPPKFLMQLLDVSANGEHAIFIANGKLLPEGKAGGLQLYEHARGLGLRFVCILPGGESVSGLCTAGSSTLSDPIAETGRISADGQRIFWSTSAGEEGKLYVRIGGTQTVAVSEGGEEGSGTSKSLFWGAASDGSVAIFSTRVSGSESDLYEFDVDGKETTPIAGGVLGVMGISEDASRVYFASTEVLSEETNGNGDKAQEGEANLYLHEAGGGTRFIATLAGADLEQGVLLSPYRRHTARVSSDGAHVAFVSEAAPTGYDNKDAQSGAPTAEIYRYDATKNVLLCVSCNPSGARPAGRAQIPPWETPSHAARVLSDDGSRLYFESADALAARDTDGSVDVYQWEQLGRGGCDEAEVAFSPAAGGCIELISSGQSPFDSRFVEASPTGGDVFFATGSSLLPQDSGVFDIYDARVDGGLPIPTPPPPPCEGDTCAAQIPAPEEPTPASSDYAAPHAPRHSSRRCAKGKRRVSVKGKSRCVAKRGHRRAAR